MALGKVPELGTFIREQRHRTRMSLRTVASLSGISNPYLSQIERGLRKPSAEILQGIAKALRISAETLYVKAGILDEQPSINVTSAIEADPRLSRRQKDALMGIYESYLVDVVEVPQERTEASVPDQTSTTPQTTESVEEDRVDTSSDPIPT